MLEHCYLSYFNEYGQGPEGRRSRVDSAFIKTTYHIQSFKIDYALTFAFTKN